MTILWCLMHHEYIYLFLLKCFIDLCSWQIYVGCWTFTWGWYSCALDIHLEGAEGVCLYYLCGVCSRFPCYDFLILICPSNHGWCLASFLILFPCPSLFLTVYCTCLCYVFILTEAVGLVDSMQLVSTCDC
jgi:hypothetical protein